jgi:hypothetical protein
MFQNDLLQDGTVTNRYITKQFGDIMVCYLPAHYSHNQQGSTNPRIDMALSLTNLTLDMASNNKQSKFLEMLNMKRIEPATFMFEQHRGL